jgi:membrane-associated phospholipid phosphatase
MSAEGPRALWLLPAVAWLGLALVWIADVDTTWTLGLNAWGTGLAHWPWIQLTTLGDGAVLAALLAPWLARRPDVLRALLVSALAVTLVTRLGKVLIDAPRPPVVLGVEALEILGPLRKRHAFPSGHTGAAFAMAALVWLGTRRRDARVAALAVAAGVGLSRVVVGAHWPRDVLAGAGVGWIVAHGAWWLAARWRGGVSVWVQTLAHVAILVAAIRLVQNDGGFESPPHMHVLAGVCGVLGSIAGLVAQRRVAGGAASSDTVTGSADESPGG